MHLLEVFTYPGYEVVLKGTFNELVKEIRGYEFVDIGAREIIGERLRRKLL